jgi:tetratricopeptide (TPR) repeat protein
MEKRAAFVKLLKNDREAAIDLFSRARSHGLNEDELGSGAQILMDAALSALNEGAEAYEALDLEHARARFERAVELDPGLLSAHNHLGVVCYQIEDDEAAIEHWSEVWRVALAESLILPEPVEINLARAYVRSGAVEDAKRVLKESLEASPKGPHSVSVQRHLDAVSAE